jgi:probable rRNA maturation factor
MVLIDPDLTPDRTASTQARLSRARAAAAPANIQPRVKTKHKEAWAGRLPTTATLSRFISLAQSAIPLRGEVNVLLTTDREIRRLNRQFRGKDKPTDVLSFPAAPIQNAKPAERVAGDLAISVETARHQAAEQGHALTCELKVLILHGLLHLAGHDHESDQGQMHRRESRLRAALGLPLGLIERTSSPRPPQAKKSQPAKPRSRCR